MMPQVVSMPALNCLREAAARVLGVERGRAQAHLGGEGDVHALIAQAGDVQAAVGRQRHFQALAIFHVQGAHAPRRAVVAGIILDAEDGVKVAHILAQRLHFTFFHGYGCSFRK